MLTSSKVKYPFYSILVILIVTAPPCPENQCFGRGTCTSSVALGFQCTCTFPFVGERCEGVDSTYSGIIGDENTGADINPSVLIPAILIPIAVVLIVLTALVFLVLLVLLRRQNSKNSKVEKKEDGQSAYENVQLDKTPSRKELL